MQPHNEKKPNRLIYEKSPYLLQHAYNPVNWYPWSQEAIEKAKEENKPIFLSIGYSTCHWCHVMEKECFEDEQVAKLLNETFVCIKVDREERPDLDAAYMAVCQAMGRNCGWPLNILLTPKLNPFIVMSYIPKYSRPGVIGMLDLVPQVMQVWKQQSQQAEIVGADVKARIQAIEKRANPKEMRKEVLEDVYDRLVLDYDHDYGGFGSAPKFPTPHKLLFLLRYYAKTGQEKPLDIVKNTLDKMRQGGICDQLGFGFHRYSTDAKWLVPHFEKMLYDQALLVLAYTEAYQATGFDRYANAAKEIVTYVLRDLASPEGGYYSAQDADTEGEEGKFYVWTEDEILDALPPADAELAIHFFGIRPDGNFPGYKGKNILHVAESLEELASYKGLTLQELINRLHGIREKLFEVRKKRAPPATDQKVLTDWNGLMIAALAKAGNVFAEEQYLKIASETADFFLTNMREGDVLYHRYFKGEKAVAAFLDDYAFLVFSLIELYEATFQHKYLQAASEFAKSMISKFWDKDGGGFYQTETSTAGLPKIKQLYDGAIPSGNSIALYDLIWLSRLTGEATYESMANQMTKTFALEIEDAPEAYTFFLTAYAFQVGPSYNVVIIGDLNKKDTVEMLKKLRGRYLPTTMITLKAPSKTALDFQQIDGRATAYVCQNQTCLPPTSSIATMLEQLGVKSGK